MNASPAKGAGRVEAAEEAGERETNASGWLTAPEATGRRGTKEPCSVETAKSTGAQETNVPEERSAAVRRDGEPLANAAKRRRQREVATDEQQVATGGAVLFTGGRGAGGCTTTSRGSSGSAAKDDWRGPPAVSRDIGRPWRGRTQEFRVHPALRGDTPTRGERNADRIPQGRHRLPVCLNGEASRPGSRHERRGFGNGRLPTG